MALSALARLARKQAFQEFDEGIEKPRTDPLPTAPEGFARGSLGAQGSKTLERRDSDAGEEEDRETLQSPIMGAFMNRAGGIV